MKLTSSSANLRFLTCALLKLFVKSNSEKLKLCLIKISEKYSTVPINQAYGTQTCNTCKENSS